ncbi:hypothetical protein [Glycomyces salinus]|uniref:hypothetical protein n=1 Tax=Glycomyces salinus TaxID=980294 RepID=UPI0018EAD112|nr:hypothetical protein [Glycomyces salinus]
MSYGWGPSYGDPSHPTTNELPQVGNGVKGTGEFGTVQIDLQADPDARRSPGPVEPAGRHGRPDPSLRQGWQDATGEIRVGNGRRGSVGPVSVQVDRAAAPDPLGVKGDTQLLPRFMPKPEPEPEAPAAEQAAQPDITTSRSMPVQRRQLGPDWTQMPLRLLAAAVVTMAVLGLSAASLIYIAEWINP